MFVNNNTFSEDDDGNPRLAYFRRFLKHTKPPVRVTSAQFRKHEAKGFVCPANEGEETPAALLQMKQVRKRLMKSLSVAKSREATIQTAIQSHTATLREENMFLRKQNQHDIRMKLLLKYLLIGLMAQLSSKSTASAETTIKTNFVYTKLNSKPIPFNEEMHYAYQNVHPCGFYKVLDILDDISTRHSHICNTTWPQNDVIDDLSKVKDYNDEYLMLPSPLTYEAGLRACQALGTGLAEVRNPEQKEAFIDILLSNTRTMAFAGVGVSEYQNALIYHSDGLAINVRDPKNELFTVDNKPILWDKFMSSQWRTHTNSKARPTSYMFQYTVITENLQISKKMPKSLLLNPIHDSDIYRDAPLTIVCNRRKDNTSHSTALARFKSNCRQSHVDLNLMTVNTRLTLDKLLPSIQDDFHLFNLTNNDFYNILRTENGYQPEESISEKCAKVEQQGYNLFLSSPPQVVDFEGFYRSRRSTATATKLAPIFNVMTLALKKVARPIMKYATSRRSSNPSTPMPIHAQEIPQNDSASILTETISRKLKEKLDRHSNSTQLLIQEQQLRLDAMHIVLLVDMAASNLESIINSNKELPLSRIWTDKVYQNVRLQLDRMNIKLDHSMDTATFRLTRTIDSFHIDYQLPYQEQKRKAHIFKVQSLPLIYNSTIYISKPYAEYMAVDWQKDHFMPMSYEEVNNCFSTTCTISSPLRHKFNNDYCGMDAYFQLSSTPYSNPACQYQVKDHTRPYDFISAGNITYFSAAANTTIEMKCRRDDDVKTNVQHIHGLGYLVMPNHCDATVDKLVIKLSLIHI